MKVSKKIREWLSRGFELEEGTWIDEIVALEEKIKRQAEQLTRANAALSPRKQEAMRWKRLHHELGKKYAAVKND